MHSRYLAFAVCFAVSIGAPAGAQLGTQGRPSSTPPAAGPHDRAAESKGPAQISQYVREVYQDREGNLWLGTNGEGVARYDGESLEFFGPAQGFDGVLWFGCSGGLFRLEGERFVNVTREGPW